MASFKRAEQLLYEYTGTTFAKPSAMPGYSYSTPAKACMTGSKLRKVTGSICANCFAHGGFYGFPGVQAALDKRLAAVRRCETDVEARGRWIRGFVHALREALSAAQRIESRRSVPAIDVRAFRWHDSGDLQGSYHLGMIVEVARRMPAVQFWLPTKEYKLVEELVASGTQIPANLTIRLSAPMVGRTPRRLVELAKHPRIAIANSHKPGEYREELGFWCLKTRDPERAGCGHGVDACRACWDPTTNVTYTVHR